MFFSWVQIFRAVIKSNKQVTRVWYANDHASAPVFRFFNNIIFLDPG